MPSHDENEKKLEDDTDYYKAIMCNAKYSLDYSLAHKISKSARQRETRGGKENESLFFGRRRRMDGRCISNRVYLRDLSLKKRKKILYSWKSENGSYTDFLLSVFWFSAASVLFLDGGGGGGRGKHIISFLPSFLL